MAGFTDPFATGLLAITGAQNPELFANAAAQSGISPSGDNGMANLFGAGGPSLGQFLSAAPAGLPPAAGGTAFQGGGPTGAPAGGPGIAEALKGLQGFKGPDKPPAPILAGGIRGAQQAPGQQFGGFQGGQLLQALQAVIQPAQGVAPLGTFLGGR